MAIGDMNGAGEAAFAIPMRRPAVKPVELTIAAPTVAGAGGRYEEIVMILTPLRPGEPPPPGSVPLTVREPVTFAVTLQGRVPGPTLAAAPRDDGGGPPGA